MTGAAAPASGEPLDLAVGVEDERWVEVFPNAERTLTPVVEAALAAGGAPPGPIEMGIVLADDETVRQLNRDYRGKDQPTNVLSFALTEGEDGPATGGPVMLGDVVLAYETVMREAAEGGKRPQDHACHLVVHGVLHLLGYDHGDDAAAAEMERLEISVLAEFGLADPYADEGPAGGRASAPTATSERRE